jgi:hypothetical protein
MNVSIENFSDDKLELVQIIPIFVVVLCFVLLCGGETYKMGDLIKYFGWSGISAKCRYMVPTLAFSCRISI